MDSQPVTQGFILRLLFVIGVLGSIFMFMSMVIEAEQNAGSSSLGEINSSVQQTTDNIDAAYRKSKGLD